MSFFSFVYICNYVVYEHQSGYVDDNTILTSTYREILNDTDDYIREDTKAMQILASKLLGELKNEYTIKTTYDNSVSLQELKDKLAEIKDTLEDAKEGYNNAKYEATRLKKVMIGYEKSRINTGFHDRQDMWERKYIKAQKSYKDAVKDMNSKKATYKNAKKNYTAAQSAVTNYKKSQDTVIVEFLQEMLKPSPSPRLLEGYINELNAMIVDSGENVDIINNYGKLVESTQTLTVVVQDYISLIDAYGDADEEVNDNSIKYLMEHAMDDTMTPDPKSKSFNSDYAEWRSNWETRLNTLENVIQHLPKFSESEKDDLKETPIDVELLSNYKSNNKMHIIDELRRNKVSDINVIEKASSLLLGRYRFTAWFSFALALFFDLSSLLSGLFIYGIQKKSSSTLVTSTS